MLTLMLLLALSSLQLLICSSIQEIVSPHLTPFSLLLPSSQPPHTELKSTLRSVLGALNFALPCLTVVSQTSPNLHAHTQTQ